MCLENRLAIKSLSVRLPTITHPYSGLHTEIHARGANYEQVVFVAAINFFSETCVF